MANIIPTWKAFGGDEADLEKVVVLERIAQQFRKDKEEAGKE